MGLGRLCDPGLAALPDRRSEHCADLQLVESVCTLGRSKQTAGSDYQPTDVIGSGGPTNHARWPDDDNDNPDSRRGEQNPSNADPVEHVFEGVDGKCGAVDFGRTLATDFEQGFRENPGRTTLKGTHPRFRQRLNGSAESLEQEEHLPRGQKKHPNRRQLPFLG